MKLIDLHVHSTASDGTFTPTELILEAKRCHLSAIALTDHDSVNGISEALDAGKKSDIEVVPGIELSTSYKEQEIHIVGLYIDPQNSLLREKTDASINSRDHRNLLMIEKLKEFGFDISAEQVYAQNPDTVVARPHIARYLVDSGQVSKMQTVFDKYIGDDGPCYVKRTRITATQAIELIHQAHGLAILAHPCLYDYTLNELRGVIQELKAAGLDGIEVKYSCNQGSDEKDYTLLAREFDLLLSGGSDFHGANKAYIHLGTGRGNLAVPYNFLEEMKKKIRL